MQSFGNVFKNYEYTSENLTLNYMWNTLQLLGGKMFGKPST